MLNHSLGKRHSPLDLQQFDEYHEYDRSRTVFNIKFLERNFQKKLKYNETIKNLPGYECNQQIHTHRDNFRQHKLVFRLH